MTDLISKADAPTLPLAICAAVLRDASPSVYDD
jgi:hypothetical protein